MLAYTYSTGTLAGYSHMEITILRVKRLYWCNNDGRGSGLKKDGVAFLFYVNSFVIGAL
jgi:hypothetical protein